MRSTARLVGLVGIVGLVGTSGCNMLAGRIPQVPAVPGATTTAASADTAKHDQESQSALTKVVQQNLDQCVKQTEDAEKALGEALDKAGASKPTLGDDVAKLRKEKVTVTVQNVGTPQNPVLIVKDSLMEQGAKIAAASNAERAAFAKKMMAAQPFLTPVRDDVSAVNGAFGKAFLSTMSCQGYAQGFTTQLGAMKNGGQEPTPELFATYAKFLQANARSEAVVASAMGLVSAMQAGLAGKDPKAIDKLVVALKDASTQHPEVTETQARQAYALAADQLVAACQKQLDDYAAKNPQAKTSGPSPCSPEGSRPKGPPPLDPNDPQADLVNHLVPSDGPMAAAADGLAALSKGDYLGAFKSATKLVPKGSPVGAALNLIGSLFG